MLIILLCAALVVATTGYIGVRYVDERLGDLYNRIGEHH
jgi:hypothetical protein